VTPDVLGVSYVPSSGTVRDIIVIQEWPGPSRITELVWKTPSRIAYATDVENEAILGGQNAIGYQVTAKMKSYTWFKLLLDRTQATKFDDPGLTTSEGLGVLRIPTDNTVRGVVSDYLREVYQHTMKYLENKMSHEVLDVTNIEFWFTVPAIWSDAARADTMDAARLAGFGSRRGDNINLIPEPEAAAISTLSGITSDGSEVQVEVRLTDSYVLIS
jgi:molecular chaperone DnaK (HSP70)